MEFSAPIIFGQGCWRLLRSWNQGRGSLGTSDTRQRLASCAKCLREKAMCPEPLRCSSFDLATSRIKGIAFCCAAMLGRRGILAWNAVAEFKRNRQRTEMPKHMGKENPGSDVRAIMAAEKILGRVESQSQ